MKRVQHLIQESVQKLEALGKASALLDVRLLLSRALSCPVSKLISQDQKELSSAELEAFSKLFERRVQHEPIAYILGYKEFYGHEFFVNSSVLIPRPETELVVELGLRLARDKEGVRICDLGTGSGAIILSIAKQLGSSASYLGIDISEEALSVAQENSKRLGLSNVRFKQHDIRKPLNEEFDLIVSNPPYIPQADEASLSPEIRIHEPAQALFANDQGDEFYQAIFKGWMSDGRRAILETYNQSQRERLRSLVPQEWKFSIEDHCLVLEA